LAKILERRGPQGLLTPRLLSPLAWFEQKASEKGLLAVQVVRSSRMGSLRPRLMPATVTSTSWRFVGRAPSREARICERGEADSLDR